MLKSIKLLTIPAALALAGGAGIATAPAQAEVRFDLHLGTPGYYHYRPYYRPYHYRPYGYYRPNCYWDRYYGRVCY